MRLLEEHLRSTRLQNDLSFFFIGETTEILKGFGLCFFYSVRRNAGVLNFQQQSYPEVNAQERKASFIFVLFIVRLLVPLQHCASHLHVIPNPKPPAIPWHPSTERINIHYYSNKHSEWPCLGLLLFGVESNPSKYASITETIFLHFYSKKYSF